MTHPTREEAARAHLENDWFRAFDQAIRVSQKLDGLVKDAFLAGVEYEAPIAEARTTKRSIEMLMERESDFENASLGERLDDTRNRKLAHPEAEGETQ